MIQFLLIALLSLLAQFVLPWWSLALVAFLVCLITRPSALAAFGAGFFGVALVWLIYALVVQFRTDGIMTARMSQLLFKADQPVLLIAVTVLIGGLVGGLAGLSGYYVRQAVQNQGRIHPAE
ncbi:hypothetical protein BN8_05689 [Fibrisoma limi BUZ 3]|uniref:Transmembrane protein n=1 Tax=Fibrisoma limi BUZ 3 TaxID=1185876 RepID=I2GR32_9BACT|nr:hypothetical protein [Fibrisoma limi]CCH56360.1 hypothetical protein BN8_05689 [Fibrisoma limi BUZ 3]